jgi:IS30 family transposase
MKHFTLEDREILADLLQRGVSKRGIAQRLRKSHSSVLTELTRNNFRGNYDPHTAHKRYLRLKRRRTKRSKIDISPGLKHFVVTKLLSEQWSPEQIDRHLRIKSGGKCILSHESIYQFIYSNEGKARKLFSALRRKKKPIRQPFGSRKKRFIIPDRVSIHRRHKSIKQRTEFGHWEIDLMIFSKQKFVLATAVERSSRFTLATILPNKSAQAMRNALRHFILDYGQQNFRSLTFDNGSENAHHYKLKHDFPGLQTFFCDPYCSWQKGTNENTNGLLRQYLPRSTDLGSLSQADIDNICHKLNHRPRKCINFLQPHFLFSLLSQNGRFIT